MTGFRQVRAMVRKQVRDASLRAVCVRCVKEFTYVPPLPGMMRDTCDTCTLKGTPVDFHDIEVTEQAVRPRQYRPWKWQGEPYAGGRRPRADVAACRVCHDLFHTDEMFVGNANGPTHNRYWCFEHSPFPGFRNWHEYNAYNGHPLPPVRFHP